MRLKTVISVCVLGSLWIAGCGGDDKKGGGGGGASYAEVSDAIAHPTGTLAANNAKGVADEYAKVPSGAPGGDRIAQSSYDTACPAGGTISTSGTSSGNGTASGSFSYNNCCSTEGCCFNGDGSIYYSTNTDGTAAYTYCASYNIDYTCGGTYSLDYSGCLGSGGWTYVVEFSGETFAVSGSYNNGSGTLTITGANGTYTCTYTNGSGTCDGDTDFSF